MSFKNLKDMKSEKGFTIVELLIVIIVIGILAAIIIVAYNGVTAKANNTAAQSAAVTIAKKIEAFNGQTGAYPVFHTPTGDVTTQLGTDPTTTLTGSGLTIGTPSSSNGKTTVQVKLCGNGAAPVNNGVAVGYQIFTWDFANNALSTTPVNTGGVNVAANCTATTA